MLWQLKFSLMVGGVLSEAGCLRLGICHTNRIEQNRVSVRIGYYMYALINQYSCKSATKRTSFITQARLCNNIQLLTIEAVDIM